MFSIQKIDPDQIDTLIHIAASTFRDAFYHLSKPKDFEAYVSAAFTTDNFLSQLANPDSQFYFALWDDKPVGYLKINFNDAQTELQEKNGAEIERIYVLSEHQGKKTGQLLMDFAINIAIERQMEYVWLGVWEKNPNAIRFYERQGFKIFGKHTFPFGESMDEDYLMKLEL